MIKFLEFETIMRYVATLFFVLILYLHKAEIIDDKMAGNLMGSLFSFGMIMIGAFLIIDDDE